MKFSLTIESDNPAQLAGILAQLGGSTAAIVTTLPQTVTDEADGPIDTNAPAFDSAGLPWDERIHAASKTTNKDGTWRSKRNISETLVATVTAELRTRAGMTQQPAPQAFQPPVQQYAPQAFQPPVQQFVAPPQFQAPPAAPVQQYAPPVAPVQEYQQPAPAAPMAPVGMDFQTFMGGIQRGMTTVNPQTGSPFIDQAYIGNLVGRLSQHLGRQLNAITDVHSDLAAISVAVQMIQQDGRWL